ncbi:MFS transporter [soil metagenome]
MTSFAVPSAVSPRASITTIFFLFGATLGLWSGSIPTVMAAASVGAFELGLGLTAYTIAYVLAMLAGAPLARLATSRAIFLTALPFMAITAGALFLSATPAVFFVALTAFGVVLGLHDVLLNAEASRIESDLGRPVFTSFHGAASVGMAIFAIIGSLLTVEMGLKATALLLALLVAGGWLLLYSAFPSRRLALPGPALSELPSRTPLVILGLAVGLVITGETAAMMWSATLLQEQAPRLAAIAGAGAAFFTLCVAIVRFSGDYIRARAGDIPLLVASLIVAMIGFALIGLSESFWTSVFAFALVGFGTACVVPVIFSLAAGYTTHNRAAAISFVALVSGLPRALAPWFFGWVAAGFSTGVAFGLCTAAMALALGLVFLLRAGRA